MKILNKYKVTRLLYKSAILAYGFDNHLGLFNGLIQPNINFFFKYFNIVYIPSLLIIISLFLFICFCQLKFNENNVSNISKNLFTKNTPDPDILIRTGNTKRLSN